jgi:antitoxin (DNA-binding transcriptional repressor) of toxin-antitoxin stability system
VYNWAVTELSISEARAQLPDVVNRVIAGEEITLTRHGQPVVVMLRPDAVRTRSAAVQAAIKRSKDIRKLLEDARGKALPPPTMSAERAEQLIADIRSGRARR